MKFCAVCGRPRSDEARTCGGCGSLFDGRRPARPPGPSGAGDRREGVAGRPPSPRWLKPAVLSASGVLAAVLAVSAIFLWPSGSQGLPGGQGQPGDGTSAVPSSPAAAPSPTAISSDQGPVAMTAAAAQEADASAVVSFLDSYFTAINAHSYQNYEALLSPQLQQQMTRADFDSGYQGTSDSAETLVSTSVASNGDTAAAVTFTSHQDPTAANNEQTCTSWQITLFLQPSGSGYLIDRAPHGYQAVSTSCS